MVAISLKQLILSDNCIFKTRLTGDQWCPQQGSVIPSDLIEVLIGEAYSDDLIGEFVPLVTRSQATCFRVASVHLVKPIADCKLAPLARGVYRTVISRYFPAARLKIGHTVAFRQSLCTCPVARDKLNRRTNCTAVNGVRILRIFGCNRSGLFSGCLSPSGEIHC